MTILFLLLAISVKQDGTRLRSGCSADEGTVATLASGAAVTIRYAIAGESTPCYKVAAQAEGKSVEGYLSASEIDGLNDFDQARREASRLDLKQVMQAIVKPAGTAAPAGTAGDAAQFIESGQPAKALEILQAQLKVRRDPALFALAGVAAWKADDSRHALEYWHSSIELQPNPAIEALIRRVERESKSDQSGDRLTGMRVVLRYDGVAVKTDTARQMLAALDDEYFRISQQLGCTAEEKIVAIVQTQDAYRATTNAAEWSGGQFDGRIRIPVLTGQAMDANMRRIFAHETVHACLAMLGRWPAWLHEGLAQQLSGDTLRPAVREKIAGMIRDRTLPRLENLGQNWSSMDTDHAVAAYGLSLAAVELLSKSAGGVGDLIRHPDRLDSVTAGIDSRLGLQ